MGNIARREDGILRRGNAQAIYYQCITGAAIKGRGEF
jgi:hypothetical protein